MLGTRFPKYRQAGRRAVVRVSVAKRLRPGLDDVRRRREIRLTDLEVDDPPPLRLERRRPREHLERRLRPEPLEAARQHGGNYPYHDAPARRRARALRWLPGFRNSG